MEFVTRPPVLADEDTDVCAVAASLASARTTCKERYINVML